MGKARYYLRVEARLLRVDSSLLEHAPRLIGIFRKTLDPINESVAERSESFSRLQMLMEDLMIGWNHLEDRAGKTRMELND